MNLVVSTGSSITPLMATYDPSIGEWRASYSSTLFDLIRGGTWTLNVSAGDTLGNSGKATYEVVAQPYLFISVIVGVVAGPVCCSLVGVPLWKESYDFPVKETSQAAEVPQVLSGLKNSAGVSMHG